MRGGAHAAGSAGSGGSGDAYRGVTVKTGFRGEDVHRGEEESILDRFFGPPRRNVRVIR